MLDSWAERCARIALVCGDDGILQSVFDEVIRTRSAVVKHKVVEILAVLRTVIDEQGVVDLLLLLLGEIQFLPIGGTTDLGIVLLELEIGLDTQLIVSVALDKLDIKVVSHEGEDTVIEDTVDAIGYVHDANTCVAVFRPYFSARCAGEQIDLGAIAELLSKGQTRAEKQYEKHESFTHDRV